MITDLVAAQPRTLPAVILDKVPVHRLRPGPADRGRGHPRHPQRLRLRWRRPRNAGAHRTSPRWPTRRCALPTSARRASCASRRPCRSATTTWASRTSTTPPSARVNFMREILGYVPIEPDGSVPVRVPANVAFVISVLDADGRRLFPAPSQLAADAPRRRRALQRLPPRRAAQRRIVRMAAMAPALPSGLAPPATGVPFPATEAALLAECRRDHGPGARAHAPARPGQLLGAYPSVDLVYDRRVDRPGHCRPRPRMRRSATAMAALVTRCADAIRLHDRWACICRIVINYVPHHSSAVVAAHPLAADDVTVVMANTCTNCHSPRGCDGMLRACRPDSSTSAMAIPTSSRCTSHAYRELLFADNEQEVNMGALQDRLVPVTTIDPVTGLPVTTRYR